MAVNQSRTYGILASLSQVFGVFIFTYLSPIVGLAFHIVSGFFWILEGIAVDVMSGDMSFTKTNAKLKTLGLEANIFWQNLRLTLAGKKSKTETSNLAASIFAIIGAILMTIGLFVATGPLGWAMAGCGVLSGIFWYISAQHAENRKSTNSENMNKIAAVFEVICALCFAATLGLSMVTAAPAVAGAIGILGIIGISTAIGSALAWMMSYFFRPKSKSDSIAPATNTVEDADKILNENKNHATTKKTVLTHYSHTLEYKISRIDPSYYQTEAHTKVPPEIYKEWDPRHDTVKSVFTKETTADESRQIEIAKACIIAAQKLCQKSSVNIDGSDVALMIAAIKVCERSNISFAVANNTIAQEALSQAKTKPLTDEYLLNTLKQVSESRHHAKLVTRRNNPGLVRIGQ